MQELYSFSLERSLLGAFIKFPNIWIEVDSVLKDEDFYHSIHKTIYCIIRNQLSKGEKLDSVVLAQHIKNLNISTVDEIDIFEYIKILASTQITTEGALEGCKELIKLRVRREIVATAEQVKEFIIKNSQKNFDELINGADAIYNKKILSYGLTDEPIDLFDGLEEKIIARGQNPHTTIGFVTPYPEFNRLYGGVRNGNVYAWVSRAGIGKSAILADMGYKMTFLNPNLKTLFLDTENLTGDMSFRQAASLINIPPVLLEGGTYVKNREAYAKVMSKINDGTFKNSKNRVFHYQCANKNIQEISAIIRRWYFGKVGRGNPALIIYDYIKITGEIGYNKQEYQLIGDKINTLKELSVELNVPILTANQLNRTAESGTDDSSAIAQSDRLNWFASFVAIFRRKTLEEIAEDGLEFGSHKMIVLKSRHRGEDSGMFSDLVKVKIGDKKFKYVNNYLNFKMDNFNIEELGSLRDIIKSKQEQYDIEQHGNISSEEEKL